MVQPYTHFVTGDGDTFRPLAATTHSLRPQIVADSAPASDALGIGRVGSSSSFADEPMADSSADLATDDAFLPPTSMGHRLLNAALRALAERLAEALPAESTAVPAPPASSTGQRGGRKVGRRATRAAERRASISSTSDTSRPGPAEFVAASTPADGSGASPAPGPAPGPATNPAQSRVELLLAGGAAGMLSGLLDPDRTTTDCDVMLYHPPAARELVERLAADVGAEFGLSEHWLNAGGAPWAEAMPPGWQARRQVVFAHGPLVVHAVGRLDLVALKLFAGRAQDIEDLEAMSITADEVSLLRRHFGEWSDDSWPPGVIEGARELLEILAEAPEFGAETTRLRTDAFVAGEVWLAERPVATDASPPPDSVGHS